MLLGGGCVRDCEQKWSKGKAREKLSNAVLFDAKTFDRLVKEVPKVRACAVLRVHVLTPPAPCLTYDPQAPRKPWLLAPHPMLLAVRARPTPCLMCR